MNTCLDHIVIGASSLKQGVRYVKEKLGVDIPAGGSHPLMGTSNHLMRLANSTFLEVIAIDPSLRAVDHPCWYGLDDPFVRLSLDKGPRLISWVVSSPDIYSLMSGAEFSFGKITKVSRGALKWLFGVPDDGRLLAGGLLPYIIQWESKDHPSGLMADLKCGLEKLEIYHGKPEWLLFVLKNIGADNLVEVKPLYNGEIPYMSAFISTPLGTRVISGNE